MRPARLSTKILLVVIASSLVTIGSTLAFIAYNIERSSEASAFNEAKAWAESASARVSIELTSVQYATAELAHIVSLYRQFPSDRLGGLLDGMLSATLENEKRLINVWLILEPGTVLPGKAYRRSWHRMGETIQPRDVSNDPLPQAYELARSSMKSLIVEPYRIEDTGSADMQMGTAELASSIVIPIMTMDGTMLGVVGADFGLSHFQESMGGMTFLKTGYGELLTNLGVVVTSRSAKTIGSSAHELEDDQASEVRAAIEAGRPFNLLSRGDEHGKSAYKYFAPVKTGEGTAPWSFLVVVPLEEVLQGVRRLVIATVAIGSISLVLLSILLSLILSRMTDPLKATVVALKDIAEGEGDLTRRIQTRQRDEIGQLAGHFNRFSESLAAMVGSIVQAAEKLSSTGAELSMQMGRVGDSSARIGTSVAELRKDALIQFDGIEVSEGSIKEILERIEQLNRLIVDQSASVTESSASIEEMIANIKSVAANIEKSRGLYDDLVKASEDGMGKIAEVSRVVAEISRQSESLSEANDVISRISSTTNLLAMNAAIEAAHAGDAGKGFAVVADEIRNLAENANDQSRNIAQNLKMIQESIRAVVSSSENAERGFTDVRMLITSLFGLQEEVMGAMSEQSEGSSQILEAIGQINEVTSEVRGSSDEMRRSSAAVADQIITLLDATQRVKVGIENISRESAEIQEATGRALVLTETNAGDIAIVSEESGKFSI